MLLQIFAAWPLPAAPAWTMVLAHRLQHRLRALEAPVAAADHEGERARRGAADAARDGRIEHVEALLGGCLGDDARALDVDGRAVDQQGTALRGVEDAIIAGIDSAHLRPGRQHRHDDLGLRDRAGDVAGGEAAGFRQRVEGGARRSKPVTSWPALSRFAAMGPPILPRPMKPIRIALLLQLKRSSRSPKLAK